MCQRERTVGKCEWGGTSVNVKGELVLTTEGENRAKGRQPVTDSARVKFLRDQWV